MNQVQVRSERSDGFTLVEMLVVVAVMALILSAVAPMVFDTLVATKLTSAGDSVNSQLSLARQIASSRNMDVEVRFYRYNDPDQPSTEPEFRAVVVVDPPDVLVAPGAQAVSTGLALAETYYLPSGIVIADKGALSPMLRSGSSLPDAERFVRKAGNAVYIPVVFYANGSTSLTVPANQAYLTLAEAKKVEEGSAVPKNFYTLQLDPVTGRSKVFRPGN
jgi:uncharacterized protein (TIGR02596 family)